MKKYYKVASIALAGTLALTSVVPISALAEEKAEQAVINREPAAEADSAIEQPVATAVEETPAEVTPATEETTDVTVNLSSNADDNNTTENNNETSAEVTPVEVSSETTNPEEVSAEASSEEETEEETEENLEEKLLNDEELELLDAKEDEDFNSDGINDLYTKMLCDGEILTESGKKVFGDYSYLQVQQTNDLDGDGLKNGEEVVVKTREDGSLYAILTSDPCLADTDGDGIKDYDDTDKWHRGLYGGVIGNVRLVARHDDAKSFKDGHVYIVYTSYVDNNTISLDNLYGYYVTNPEYKARLREACDNEDSVVSWRSTVDELNEAEKTDANEAIRKAAADDMYVDQNITNHTSGSITLNRGDYCSVGNYGMSTPIEEIKNNYIPFLN